MSTTEISNLQTEISNLKNMYNLLLDNYSKLKDDNQLLTQRIMKLETNTTQHKPPTRPERSEASEGYIALQDF